MNQRSNPKPEKIMGACEYKKEIQGNYKYVLLAEFQYSTGITIPFKRVILEYLELDMDGLLTIMPDYAWDGPSGPTIDTKTFMCGSLVHDALYQLMRERCIGQEHRLRADQLLREICLESGMARFRAWYVFHAVRWRGAKAAQAKPPGEAECKDSIWAGVVAQPPGDGDDDTKGADSDDA